MIEANIVTLRLLDEIDSICNEHGLLYFLTGEAAYNAHFYGSFHSPTLTAEVMMPLNDILEFSKYIDTENRVLESTFTNIDFKGYHFNYIDKNTLFYNAYNRENTKYPGIHVRIRAIKQDNGNKASKRASTMKRFWKRYCDADDPEEMITGHRFKTKLKQRIMKTWISTRPVKYHSDMLDQIVASQKDFDLNGKTYVNKLTYAKGYDNRNWLPKGFFSEYKMITLEGHEYRGIKNDSKMFEMVYGKKWKEKEFNNRAVRRSYIVSAAIPYEEYLKEAAKQGLTLENLDRKVDEERQAKADYNAFEKPIRKIWRQTQRNILVNKMSIQYASNKRKIVKAYKEERWDDLGTLLKEYDEYARKFARFRMLIDFDKDIMKAHHAWLRHIGDTEFDEKLKAIEKKQAEMEAASREEK